MHTLLRNFWSFKPPFLPLQTKYPNLILNSHYIIRSIALILMAKGKKKRTKYNTVGKKKSHIIACIMHEWGRKPVIPVMTASDQKWGKQIHDDN